MTFNILKIRPNIELNLFVDLFEITEKQNNDSNLKKEFQEFMDIIDI